MKRIKISKAFIIVMIFFISIFALFSSASTFPKSGPDDEVNVINVKINELENMKRGYESKAIKHAHEAERFQFMEGELQRAKQHWKLAEENKKIAMKIQKQIDELNERKGNYLKKG